MVARADLHDARMDDNVIVIPSHVSGLRFLENLLASFGGYDKYPILIVINEYKDEVEPLYQAILVKFAHLPITVGRLKSNSFEFGGLLYAYNETQFENFFLLPHSCEVVDTEVFDIAFEEYRGRSAAFFLRQNYDGSHCWESHVGKYRRETLTAVNFKRFQPHNIFQATFLSEFPFTRAYQLQEPTAHAFYVLTRQTGEVTEKFGKPRLKMSTPYLIKWKTHWSAAMIFRSFPKNQKYQFAKSVLRFAIWQCRGLVGKSLYYTREAVVCLRCGAPWSANFFRWRKELKKDPRLKDGASFIRRTRYNTEIVRFAEKSQACLFEHDLDANSLVLDVGAFNGEYADKIFHKYHCEIHCFEPMRGYYNELARRFEEEPRVHLHQVGLSNRTYQTSMGVGGLGSSEFGFFLKKEQVQMQDVAEVFAKLDRNVDLLKINIEGGEYPLLQRMIEKDLLRRCKKVMVQFHDIPVSEKSAKALRLELIEGIEKTHDPTFSYPFVWEAWERRSLNVKK